MDEMYDMTFLNVLECWKPLLSYVCRASAKTFHINHRKGKRTNALHKGLLVYIEELPGISLFWSVCFYGLHLSN